MKDVRKLWENCGLSDNHIKEEEDLQEWKTLRIWETVGRRNMERGYPILK